MNNHSQNGRIAVYALTSQGAELGLKLSQGLDADLYLSKNAANSYSNARSFGSLKQIVQENFENYAGHIFIAASGLVVRLICPLLAGKEKDPGIVVLDQYGNFAVSLVSGHLGNANELARETAVITGGNPVITTATDNMGIEAIDVLAMEKDMFISNLQAIRTVNSALLEDKKILVFDPENRLGLDTEERFVFVSGIEQIKQNSPAIIVDWRDIQPPDPQNHLVLRPRVLVAGIGCNSGTSAQEILQHLQNTFSFFGLSLKSLKLLSSTSKKQDEPGLLDAAKQLELSITFVPHEELEHIQVPNPSSNVKKNMGVSSICEATALHQTNMGKLLVQKTKSLNSTLAVALQSCT